MLKLYAQTSSPNLVELETVNYVCTNLRKEKPGSVVPKLPAMLFNGNPNLVELRYILDLDTQLFVTLDDGITFNPVTIQRLVVQSDIGTLTYILLTVNPVD